MSQSPTPWYIKYAPQLFMCGLCSSACSFVVAVGTAVGPDGVTGTSLLFLLGAGGLAYASVVVWRLQYGPPAAKTGGPPSENETAVPVEATSVQLSPETQLKPLEASGPMVFTVKMPKGAEWKPEIAQALMNGLLALGEVTLRILAADGIIRWQILGRRNQWLTEDVVAPAVRAIYPEAEVVAEREVEPPYPPTFFRILLVLSLALETEFFRPIKYPKELKEHDPLMSLVNVLAGTQAGERISYMVHIGEQDVVAIKQGMTLITRSTFNPANLFSFEGWGMEVGKAIFNKTRMDKYESAGQKVFEEKLNQGLFHTHVIVQIDVANPERIKQFLALSSTIREYSTDYQTVDFYSDDKLFIEVKTPAIERKTRAMALIVDEDNAIYRAYKRFNHLFNPSELASLWHLPYEGFAAHNILWSRSKQVQIPASMVGKREGVCLGVNQYAGQKEDVYLPLENRTTHAAIIGMTGMGKSNLMHHLIHQDIQARRGVAVIDPHGKLVRDILQTSIPENREKDVVVLDLANSDYPPPLNPLRGRLSPVAAGQILSIIERLFPDTSQYARLSRYLRAGLELLQADPEATIRDLGRLFTDFSYRERLLADCFNDEVILTWHDFGGYTETEQHKIRDPILNRISPFYSNPDLLPILCHPDTLDFKELIRDKKILLISLKMDDELVPEQERSLIGALLISRLQLSGMKDEVNPYHVYIDEVQKFVTTSLDTMFSEARKFGLALTIANQYFKQLAGHTLEAVMGNVGALVIFQCGRDDAQLLAPYVRPNFDTEDLINLDMHNAVVKMRFGKETQPAFSLVTKAPLTRLGPNEQAEAEAREKRIRRLSIETYTPKSRSVIMDWLKGRYQRPPSPKSGRSSNPPLESEHDFDTSPDEPTL